MDEKVIFIMAAVLAVILVAAGIYFLVYQRHINKALKDPEGAKKSRIKLPSLGTSYTGMWFVAWIVSVIITLVMIVDISSAAKLTVMYGEINSEKLNWLQDELARTDEKIDKVYHMGLYDEDSESAGKHGRRHLLNTAPAMEITNLENTGMR